jgi:hypothetical protein
MLPRTCGPRIRRQLEIRPRYFARRHSGSLHRERAQGAVAGKPGPPALPSDRPLGPLQIAPLLRAACRPRPRSIAPAAESAEVLDPWHDEGALRPPHRQHVVEIVQRTCGRCGRSRPRTVPSPPAAPAESFFMLSTRSAARVSGEEVRLFDVLGLDSATKLEYSGDRTSCRRASAARNSWVSASVSIAREKPKMELAS